MSEPNYKAGYERLLRALEGIRSCATACGCCEMHRRIAENAIREAPLALDVPAGTRDEPTLEIPRFLRKLDD